MLNTEFAVTYDQVEVKDDNTREVVIVLKPYTPDSMNKYNNEQLRYIICFFKVNIILE